MGATTKWSAAAVMAVLALGCGEATGPDVQIDASLVTAPTEVVLGYGQEKRIEGTELRVAFTGVGADSRCPVDVVCVWQGNAAIELRLTAGEGAPEAIELNTALDPKAADAAGVHVALLEVRPASRSDTPTVRESYSVRLRLEPIR